MFAIAATKPTGATTQNTPFSIFNSILTSAVNLGTGMLNHHTSLDLLTLE